MSLPAVRLYIGAPVYSLASQTMCFLMRSSRSFCQAHGLPEGGPVDFWTEASLFSAAGLPALVLGPGDIAQAHATDEWVALEQLDTAYELYGRVVKNDG